MKSYKNYNLKFMAKIGFVCIIILGLVFWIRDNPKQAETYQHSEDYVQMKEIPALLDFCYYSKEEWEKKIAKEGFQQIATTEAIRWILQQTGTLEHIDFSGKKGKFVTRQEWNIVYEQILDLLDEENTITIVEDVVLDIEGIYAICSSGTYEVGLENWDIQPMCALSFYIKNQQIIGIRDEKHTSAVIKNVYIDKVEEGKLHFLSNGGKYILQLAMADSERVVHQVCDLIWEEGVISRVQIKENTIQGNLITVNDTSIEIEGYGTIHRSENLPVYKTYGTIEENKLSDIVIANMNVKYVVAEDRVEAILLLEPAQISRIRVLLLADNNEIYRTNAYISGNSPFQIIKNEIAQEQAAGTVINIADQFSEGADASLQILPCQEQGELFLCDENGTKISKGYQGLLEIRSYEEGYTIVNELPIEQYLCAVVPSEMPSSYDLEALKAQAICARSYVYIQMGKGNYSNLGAHVDDSTNYQVYNKQDRDEKTTRAVLDTTGQILTYMGTPAEAYYFSTSAGVAGNGEAWNLTEDPQFGYLKNVYVKQEMGEPDLSKEDTFRQFIEYPDASFYECAMPYYRWKAVGDYTSEEVQAKIRSILTARKKVKPKCIVYRNQKQKKVKSIRKFGKLKSISVSKRSKSGIILQLQLEYEKGSVTVENEYSIRSVLGAGVTEVTLLDGSTRPMTLLPSAFAAMIPLENGTYSVWGGGYGHGIGMSQNGAEAMAKMGKSYQEILNFFFQNIEITSKLVE